MANENKLFYNTFYNREDDVYSIMMYDTETKEQTVSKIKNPKTTVYTLKEGIKSPTYYKETIPLKVLKSTKVSYKWRPYEIASLLGRRDSFKELVREKAMSQNHIFLDRRTIGSDMFIEDLTIMDYLDTLGYEEINGQKDYFDVPPIRNLKKGYYDIETDVVASDNRDMQPITCSTYYDDDTNTAEVFVHKRKDFVGQDEIIKDEVSFIKDFKDTLRKVVDDSTMDGKTKELLVPQFHSIIDNMKVNIRWYNSEKKMIEESWKVMIQDYKPMFLGIYNAVYDITHTEGRARVLGINPSKLFCHPEVGKAYKFNYFSEDPKAAKRRHNYDTESYTKIIDTQITYFALRPQDQLERESLDAVSHFELGFGKLSYSHITDYIGKLPYLDFRTYLMYNIVDVIVMAFLDIRTKDIESLITRRFIVRTEYGRVFSPMTSVTNTFYHLCKRMGYILSNDVNKLLMTQNLNEKVIIDKLREVDDTIENTYDTLTNRLRIAGGLCSDPVKFKKCMDEIMEGLENNKLLRYVMDADAVSMYPKIIEHTNVSKDSLDGRIVGVNGKEDESKIQECVQALIDKSTIRICNAFFNIPDTKELLNDYWKMERKDPYIKQNEVLRELPLDTKRFKYAEVIRKVLSKLDNTKIDDSDKGAGIIPTLGYFHIVNNSSLMRINGSAYTVTFIPDKEFEFESLADIFGLPKDMEAYIYAVKGQYFSDIDKYIKPRRIPRQDIEYTFKIDPEFIHRLNNNKLNYETLEHMGKKIDITQRTHVFLNDNVLVNILKDNTFIFSYDVVIKRFGVFKIEIETKTLQY